MAEPVFAHGKVCYLIMPSRSPDTSAAFYRDVFGWQIRSHDDGTLAFDDAVGQVSGMWATDREAGEPAGLEVHIMVRYAEATRRAIVDHDGSVVWQSGPDDYEVYGTFLDPDGNRLGYYQQSGLA
jgi:predicted enzyme related to lactoylglutathione lyase